MPRKILLADDSVTAQNMGRRILTEAGYEVITVNNGAAAMKKIAEVKPDLVVLDVHMPGYGGLEICQRLREMPKLSRIPVLLTVGKLEPFRPDDARRVNADAFVIKPFEATELLAVLTRLEDKIVPSMPDFGDDDSGWRNRLRIPAPYMKREERKEEPQDTQRPSAFEEPERAAESLRAEKVVAIDATVEPAAVTEVVPVEAKPVEKAMEIAAPEPAAAETDVPHASFASAPETSVSDMAFASTRAPSREEVSAALNTLAPAASIETEKPSAEKREDDETQEYEVGALVQKEAAGPRWTASEVSVTDEESTLVLELEMQRAYAAFAAADAARSAFHTPSLKSKPMEAAADAVSAPVDREEMIYSEIAADEIPVPSSDASAASADPEKEEKAAYAVAAAGGAQSAGSLPEVEASQVAEVMAPVAEPAVQANPELDTAWEQWKQVRDSLVNCESYAQFEKTVGEVEGSKPAATAAESETAEDSASDSNEIANIVDSVLADLKPRLMEEISRKMGKGKKK
ncbi:MAG TPA: response regulator [Terriglobales bacterium]